MYFFIYLFFKENVELPGELSIWKAMSAYAHVCVTQQFLSAVQTDNTSARSNCSSIESSQAITLLTKLFSLLAFWYLCDIKLTWTDNIIPPAELLHRPCDCFLALVGFPSSLCVGAQFPSSLCVAVCVLQAARSCKTHPCEQHKQCQQWLCLKAAAFVNEGHLRDYKTALQSWFTRKQAQNYPFCSGQGRSLLQYGYKYFQFVLTYLNVYFGCPEHVRLEKST